MLELSLALALVWFGGFFLGVFTLLGYMILRMMRNDGWDDSNINNALRVLSHVVLHAEDFGKMYYLDGEMLRVLGEGTIRRVKRPFWYVSGDEFADVVRTRP